MSIAQIQTPQASPRAKFEQIVGLTKLKIDYSRPAAKGRTIMGDLVPYGKIWRTGANADTTIEFSDDVIIAGVKLKTGKYSLFTRPGKSKWEIFFYKNFKNSGVPVEWDAKEVAASITVETNIIDRFVEHFTISIDNMTNNEAKIYLLWEKTEVVIPVEVPTDSKAIASIENTMKGKPSVGDYYQAAVYYRISGRDLKKAQSWMSKALKMDSTKYWMHFQYALILAELNQKKSAIKSSKISLKLSKEAGNQDYVRLVTKAIEKWSN